MKFRAKNIISFLILIVFVSHVLARFFIVADYVMNVKQITELFCVNKAKPMLHCDGKCYLAKQLKKQDNKEKPAQQSSKEKIDYYICQHCKLDLNSTQRFSKIESINFNYQEPQSTQNLASIFHPPCC